MRLSFIVTSVWNIAALRMLALTRLGGYLHMEVFVKVCWNMTWHLVVAGSCDNLFESLGAEDFIGNLMAGR